MKKGNITDLLIYRSQQPDESPQEKNHSISEELKIAIDNLIVRLKESDFIEQSNS